jgi:hypothetical protein
MGIFRIQCRIPKINIFSQNHVHLMSVFDYERNIIIPVVMDLS